VIPATLCLDNAVGETRRCLLDQTGQPFRLDLERWNERADRVRADELWWGRASKRMAGGRGWFLDLGHATGVLSVKDGDAITEGMMLPVLVTGEAQGDKGPKFALEHAARAEPSPARPERRGPPKDPFLAGIEVLQTIEGRRAREAVDAAIEEAGQGVVQLAGGGDIAIEKTRALTAIDIDTGGRSVAAKSFFELNAVAAREIARQIALRSIGGLAVIDFVSMKAKQERSDIVGVLATAFKQRGVSTVSVNPLSSLQLCETALVHRRRPLADALGSGPSRQGLDTLRLIESEGWSDAGRRIICSAPASAIAWLSGAGAELGVELNRRIGARWSLDPAGPDARIQARTVR
jgi:hypothetical protein